MSSGPRAVGIGVRSWQAQRRPERGSEPAAARIPVCGVLGKHGGEYLIHRRRQSGPQLGQRRGRLAQVRVDQRGKLVPPERRRPAKQLVRHAAKGVLISAPIDRPVTELLRRRVHNGSEELAGLGQHGRLGHGLADPEVRQVHLVGPAWPGIQQDVRRLTSRCTSPRSCAASSAEATAEMIRAARPAGNGLSGATRDPTSPCTSRMAMKRTSPAWPASYTE